MDKIQLRKSFLKLRMSWSEDDWRMQSQLLCQQLEGWLKTKSFQSLILYRSFRREPDISSIARSFADIPCFYPKLQGNELRFYRSAVHGPFIKNSFGLEEPVPESGACLHPDAGTICIIPGVAFDQNFYRLGYGGGYFDRFLAQSKIRTVGVCFSQFCIPTLPREQHDIQLMALCTELACRQLDLEL